MAVDPEPPAPAADPAPDPEPDPAPGHEDVFGNLSEDQKEVIKTKEEDTLQVAKKHFA